jgi:alpha-tubulin suppressor-like RCC1 family protein
MRRTYVSASALILLLAAGCGGGGDGGDPPAGDGAISDTSSDTSSETMSSAPDAGRPDSPTDQVTATPDTANPIIDMAAADLPATGDTATPDTGSDSPPGANLPLLPHAIATGLSHSCALTAAGAAHCWGANDRGQLGNATAGTGTTSPVAVSGGLAFAAISAGQQQTCALTNAGKAYCWGTGPELGGPAQTMVPAAVVGDLTFRQIAAGRLYTCGVTSDGGGYCWGANGGGELGTETSPAFPATMPTKVLGGHAFKFIGAGQSDHSCGITTAGAAWCWGANTSGQLGNDTKGATVRMPVAVKTDVKFATIGTGDLFTCGLGEDAKIYCWGDNAAGALGNGMVGNADQLVPGPIASTETFKAVAVGGTFACGLTMAGAAQCWGDSWNGQLGRTIEMRRPPVIERSTPTAVTGALTFASISAGDSHACGVATDGKAHCWGFNSRGEVGDGATMAVHAVPVAVVGGLTFSAK